MMLESGLSGSRSNEVAAMFEARGSGKLSAIYQCVRRDLLNLLVIQRKRIRLDLKPQRLIGELEGVARCETLAAVMDRSRILGSFY